MRMHKAGPEDLRVCNAGLLYANELKEVFETKEILFLNN